MVGVRTLDEARVADELDVVARGEEAGDSLGVRGMALGAQGERAQAAQDEEAVERAGDGAQGVLEEAKPLGHLRAARDRDPADRVRVAGQVLRGRVEDDVRPEFERTLEGG